MQDLAPIEKGCKGHEYDRRRGSVVAIAHRVGYRTVKEAKVGLEQRWRLAVGEPNAIAHLTGSV